MIRVIRNNNRYHFENNWLSANWHFSFGHYFDPDNVAFGPLRVFNDDVIRPGAGFPMHEHREMEIVTYVIDGELEHKDSTGGFGRIRSGEVQRMSAGTGVQHSEYNPSPEKPVHLLQMWLLPATPGLRPSYEQKRFAAEERLGKLLPIASGQNAPNAVKVHQDATFSVATLRPQDALTHALPNSRRAYLFVIDGQISVNGETLNGGDQARIENESALQLRAATPAEILLIDLPPIS